MTNRNAEPFVGRARQRLRLTKLIQIEINVGMEIMDVGQGNSPAIALILGRHATDQGATSLFPPLAATPEKRISALSNK
jgi:hypothetical protein